MLVDTSADRQGNTPNPTFTEPFSVSCQALLRMSLWVAYFSSGSSFEPHPLLALYVSKPSEMHSSIAPVIVAERHQRGITSCDSSAPHLLLAKCVSKPREMFSSVACCW
jgi:hypothetical protein